MPRAIKQTGKGGGVDRHGTDTEGRGEGLGQCTTKGSIRKTMEHDMFHVFLSTDEAYNNLHGCCKYPRKEIAENN